MCVCLVACCSISKYSFEYAKYTWREVTYVYSYHVAIPTIESLMRQISLSLSIPRLSICAFRHMLSWVKVFSKQIDSGTLMCHEVNDERCRWSERESCPLFITSNKGSLFVSGSFLLSSDPNTHTTTNLSIAFHYVPDEPFDRTKFRLNLSSCVIFLCSSLFSLYPSSLRLSLDSHFVVVHRSALSVRRSVFTQLPFTT